MIYPNHITPIKNGRSCILRSPRAEDAGAILNHMKITSGQTDYMLRYPDEIHMTLEQEAAFLEDFAGSVDSLMICAEIDGTIAANGSFSPVARVDKCRHRAEFGISIQRDYWGLGLGTAILRELIHAAREAGFEQMELEVVDTNHRGIALYEKFGFTVYGKNGKAFRLRDGSYQACLLMCLEL